MHAVHANARTTPAVRAEIARSREPTGVLAQRYSVSTETIRKWRKRGPADCQDRSSRPHTLPWKATEFPFAQRTRMDETGMVGVAGMEIGSVLVRASPSLSLIGGPSSTRDCRHGRTPADCGRRPSWSTLGRFPDARASRRPLP